MRRLLDIGRSAITGAMERLGRGFGRYHEQKPLVYDLLESDDEYLVVFDAPGVRKDDVTVRFSENTVEVRLERFRQFYEGYDMRFPGRGLTRKGKAKLPEDATVTPAGATAKLTDSGTLKVHIRKDPRVTDVDVHEEDETKEPGDEDDEGKDATNDEDDEGKDAADDEGDEEPDDGFTDVDFDEDDNGEVENDDDDSEDGVTVGNGGN